MWVDLDWASPDQIQRYADKERSRELAQKRGVLTIPGSGLITDDRQIKPAAEKLGFFPVY